MDFGVNKIVGPASKLPDAGFERRSHCEFGPDGAPYVVDFREVESAPEVGGIRVQKETGTLWRIRRTSGPVGHEPAKPRQLPLYAMQYLLIFAVLAGALALVVLVVLKLLRSRSWLHRR